MAVFRDSNSPGIPYSKNIGFPAQSVLVDNYSAYWLYFPDADAYVPPFYGGVVLQLTHTTDYGVYEIRSPFAATQSPTQTSYFVKVSWTSMMAAPTPGAVIQDVSDPTTLPSTNVTIVSGLISKIYLSNVQAVAAGAQPVLNAIAFDGLNSADPSGANWVIQEEGWYRISIAAAGQCTTNDPLVWSTQSVYYTLQGYSNGAGAGGTLWGIYMSGLYQASVGEVITPVYPYFYLDDGTFSTFLPQNYLGNASGSTVYATLEFVSSL